MSTLSRPVFGLALIVCLAGLGSRPAHADLSPPFPAEDFDSQTWHSPSALTAWQGDLFFVAVEDGRPPALYRKTHGQAARRLDDLLGPDNLLRTGFDPGGFVAGNRLFLLVHNPRVSGFGWNQLYVSDGTAGGTTLLRYGLSVRHAWVAAGYLFLVHQPPRASGRNDLWVSDGTPDGTGLLREGFHSPSDRDLPHAGTPFGDGFLYATELDLWWTDGTDAGTERWLDLGGLGLLEPRDLHADGTDVYFTAQRDRVGLSRRLYRTDGTPAGTHRVSARDQDVDHVFGLLGHRLIYSGTGWLWASGPTEADTRRLWRGSLSGRVHGGILGDEMWIPYGFGEVVRTDGTSRGTRRIALPMDASIRGIFEVPGHLILDGYGPLGQSLYATGEPSEPVRFLAPLIADPDQMVTVGRRVYFPAHSTEGLPPYRDRLWAFDIESLPSLPEPPPPAAPVPQGDLLRPENLQVEWRQDLRLRWDDTSDNETRFVVQVRRWDDGPRFVDLLTVPANHFTVEMDFWSDGPALFRVRAENGDGVSPWSEVVSATTASGYWCEAAPNDPWLCLGDGRFGVRSYWRDARTGEPGHGTPVSFERSDRSGAFWFFDEANVELVVKVLDGRAVNESFWTFYGALSDVEYWVVVHDFETDTSVTYYNPPGEICGRADTAAFPRPLLLRASPETIPAPLPASPPFRASPPVAPLPGPNLGPTVCIPDADTLCLTESGRYRATVTWRDPRSGDSGVGHAIPATSDSGYFWFFDPANVELVVKALDATAVNGFTWVFYGALTDVEYTLTVTDTMTGESKQYVNPPGNICGNADVRAF